MTIKRLLLLGALGPVSLAVVSAHPGIARPGDGSVPARSDVRLLPVTADVVAACHAAQRHIRAVMLCPTRLPRPARTQVLDRSPRPLGASGFPGVVEIGYGVEGDTSGEPLSFNDPQGFLHLEISVASQPLPPGARPARVGGRRGLLAPARPGGFQGPYFANHTRFFFRQGGVRYAATLHTFGEPATRRLLGRIVRTLVPVKSLANPAVPSGAVAIAPGAKAAVAAGGAAWVAESGSYSSPDFGPSLLTRVDFQTRRSTPLAGIGDRNLSAAVGLGSLWVAHTRSTPDGRFAAPTLTRIELSSDQAVSRRVGDRADTVTAVAAGGGSVWVGVDRFRRKLRHALVRVDPLTLRPVERRALAVSPEALTLVGDELWMLPRAERRIVRVSIPTGRIVGALRVGRDPSAIVNAAGFIWITDEREGVVRRLDPRTRVVLSTTDVGGAPFNLTPGSAGMWASIPGGGAVVLLDPSSGEIVRRIDVGGDPTVAIEAGGALEVADNSDGWLRRTDIGLPATLSPPVRPGPNKA